VKAIQRDQILKESVNGTAGAAVVTGASQTRADISKEIEVGFRDALNGYVDIHVSAITNSTGTIVFNLEDCSDGSTWTVVKSSAAVTTTGQKTIRWNVQNSTDQAYLPLRGRVKITATTGAGDSVTVDSVRISALG
jgi:hypothetical protein